VWMFLLLDFGGINTRRLFLMLKCLMLLNASAYCGSQLSSLYRRFEREKQRKYEQRIREVEMGSFIIRLVFSTFGGTQMGHASTVFLQKTCLSCFVEARGSV